MKKPLKQKVDAAIEALNEVHSDQSGPAKDNLAAIREIRDRLDDIERCLKDDCGETE